MAKFFTRRVAVIAAVVVAMGAVAAGVAVAAGGSGGGPASPGGTGPVATASVVRTSLTATVQVGGSLGYSGSYTIAAPSGASASEVAQARLTVTQDEQGLAADEQAASDAASADSQAVGADRVNVRTAQSALAADQATLSSDRAKKAKDCAGAGASSAACSADTQKVSQDTQMVSQDRAALIQARQVLAAARAAAKTDRDQNRATVQADRIRLHGDRAALASLRAAAVNPGTAYTWLPQPGQVIRRDQRVYSVSGVPVPLLYGSIAAYRAFYAGMSDGADVGELTRDLIALGYGQGLARSDHYSAATAAAVRRWQKALGLPATGAILLGEVVFEPGPIRVTTVTPTVGASTGGGSGGGSAGTGGGGGGGGTVLTATSTTPVVTVGLDVTEEYLVKTGDAVSVVLPDGTSTVGGRVESVGSVATCPGGGTTGTGGGGSSGSPCSSAGSSGSGGSNSSPTVTVTITLDRTPAGATLDQAPVNVNITSRRTANVLAVPVNALLALAGGGYGVDVVTPAGATRLVGVTTGLYSDTMVQVSGPGIRAGMRVEVPSP